MATTLQDYVGHKLSGTAYCGGHSHQVQVTVTGVDESTGSLKVETEQEFCSQTATISDTGWVQPIGYDPADEEDTLAFGYAPFSGHDESGEIELEFDFWE